MKTLALMTLAILAATAAIAQTSGNRGTSSVNRPNSSNFGWQDRQREATEASEKYIEELKAMSEEEWKKAALAMMDFEASERNFSFDNVIRIGGAAADRKARSRAAESSSDESPAWVVEFGKKKPKVLTLTLTDRNHTEVQCEVAQLLEAGAGFVGIFQTEFELLCIARPSGSS